jgi:hypothetical protein
MVSHGRRYLGYNAQTAVDVGTGLVVGAEVVQDQADWHAMPKVIEAMEAQLGGSPAHALADQGYESPSTIRYLEDKGIDSVIQPSSDLPECLGENGEGELVCPAGRPFELRHKATKRKTVYDVYRPVGGCRNCPLKDGCAFRGKRLDTPEGTDPGARFRNRDRYLSGTHEGAMRKRRLAELPFAALRVRTRFGRFERRGLANVRAEFLLWTIAYNMELILRGLHWVGPAFPRLLSWVGRLARKVLPALHTCLGAPPAPLRLSKS